MDKWLDNLGKLVRPRIIAHLAHPSPKSIQIKNFDSYTNNKFKHLNIKTYVAIITSFVIGKSSFNSFTIRTQDEINQLNKPYILFQIGIKFGELNNNNEFIINEEIPEFFYYPYDLLLYEQIKEFEELNPGTLIESKKKKKLYYVIENKEVSKPNFHLYSSWTNRRIKCLDVKRNKFMFLTVKIKFNVY